MSLSSDLPVYHDSYELLLDLFKFIRNFSREYKFTLGESMKKEMIEMIVNIYRANSSFEKRKENIQKARENVETIRLFLRLSNDLKLIDIDKFVTLNLKLERVSKQLTGWRTSSK